MRVMALDIGEVRVGVAVSDPRGAVATPVGVYAAQELFEMPRQQGTEAPAAGTITVGARLRRLIEDWEPETIVVGLPLTLAGEEGPQAARIRAVGAVIDQTFSLPVVFVDERLSSVEAKRSLREMGVSEREARGKVDMIAAALFLQVWLDACEATGENQGARQW